MARINIKALRTKYDMSQQTMASAVGLSQGFLSSIENGNSPFPDDRIPALKEAFPDEDISKYEMPDSAIAKASNIEDSDVFYQEGTPMHEILELVKTINSQKENEETGYALLMERCERLEAENDKFRREIDQKRDKIEELLTEVFRLKELLLDNGIKPSTGL